MFCSRCGTQQGAGAAFCSACGNAIVAAPPPPTTTPPVPPQYLPPPQTYMYYSPGPPPRPAGDGYSIAGIICGGLAFLFFPILLGPAGLILGGIAMSKGETKAPIALVVSGVGMVVGFIIGAMVWGM